MLYWKAIFILKIQKDISNHLKILMKIGLVNEKIVHFCYNFMLKMI